MADTNQTSTVDLAHLQTTFNPALGKKDELRSKAQKLLIQGAFADVADAKEQLDTDARFVNALAALVLNYPADKPDETLATQTAPPRFSKGKVQDLLRQIDSLIGDQLNAILHHQKFQAAEAAWRGLEELVNNTNFKANICIDILDVSKETLQNDFENNSSSIFNSALFNKVYIQEYDQYGGRPFGALIGLYEFSKSPDDIAWLNSMGKIANAAHTPFISSVSPEFFGYKHAEQVEAVKDLRTLLGEPQFGAWNKLRNTEHAAYLGLCFPRYVLRLPWHPETNPCRTLNFTESANGNKDQYLWGNSAILMARNLVKSFETSGWCQYIRGPRGGGKIEGLPVDTYPIRAAEDSRPDLPPLREMRLPVEICIPDYRELEFAESGFIPLIYRKDTAEAAFFSAQALKKSERFKNPRDSENSQLVTNLAYTFSVTRIAHYIKSIMRDNIGTTADTVYIQKTIDAWLSQYVTTVNNPDDATLRYYPFKAVHIEVKERPGEIGWYNCTVAVLPHVQFEGMNVELRLESRLGAKGI